MRVSLLRVIWLMLVLAGVAGQSAWASHLLGGEISYQYLNANGSAATPYQYRLSMTIYFNADVLTSQVPGGRANATVGIYSRTTGLLLRFATLPRTQNTIIRPASNGSCTVTGNTAVEVRLNRYEATVALPADARGYYVFFSETARNNDITNIIRPNNEGMTLYADMAPPSIPNSSPNFSDTAVAVICQGDTSIIVNNAYDPDGDRLEYSFGTPYGGTYRTLPSYFAPPPQLISYPAQYSVQQPFGPAAGSYAFLDKNTGLSRYAAPALGKYVIAVDVREYRRIAGRDSLVGTTRRDVQLVARTCEPNKAPEFSSGSATAQEHTVLEGQPLTLTTTANDPEGQRIALRAASVLLDGAGGVDATFNNDPGTVATPGSTGTAVVTGTGSVTGTFRFVPACGSARTEPYDVIVTATDNACNSKSAAVIYRVRVVAAPTVTAGPDRTVCSGETTQLGAASVPGISYQWSPATGLSSPTAANPTLIPVNTGLEPVVVPYVLTATSAGGCTQQRTVRIMVNPAPALDTISGSRSVCPTVQGVTYSVRNPRNATYQWTVAGGTIASGQGTSSITVNWGAANATASVQVLGTTAYGCPAQPATLPVVINQQLATETPAGPVRVCLGSTYTYQTQYTNGSSYAWQITGGTQVSTNQATVQVTWTQLGTTRLQVTETSNPGGTVRCLGVSAPLVVEVVAPPANNLAIAGPDRVCVGSSFVTFSLPGFATSTYQFALLNTATQQSTTLTATGNSTTFAVPAVGTYAITVLETSACAGPLYSKQFVVDPLPLAVAIAGPTRVCPENLTGLRYSLAGLAGSTYQWTVMGGTITSGQGTGSITVDYPNNASVKTVQVLETSQYGCSGPANALQVRPDNISLDLQVASVSLTSDQQVQLTFRAPLNADNNQRIVVQRRVAGTTGGFTRVGDVPNTATTYTDAADTDTQAYEYRLALANACGTELTSPAHTIMHTTALATEAAGGRAEGSVLVQWSAYQGFAVQQYEIYRVADQGAPTLVATVPGTTLRASLTTSAAGFNQCFRVKAIGAGALVSYSNDACVDFANKILLYNIITPNGDGFNDVFFIDNVALYPGSTLTIFDRWGREVYSARDYRNTWGGEKTGPGTHYYVFKLADGTQYKGWFEIVK
ncbi:gliding motility-associated C-terminal domain-containing protein [Hymenobacter aerilatus]|uniref:Gliding motility-associated C-terminal domain-containing protein n=1 Tax=Hymenobacter aerilatus TaxID=2932251 RepID=A0A8T9T2F8_9BACT|nr:gliding motility-associated C-terminal domain-containing protein [Hymenobacter aerilatus]UOR06179.1 gliding motility-associated C-terminal domain-containing protein [Hymenobacter aerilatus]